MTSRVSATRNAVADSRHVVLDTAFGGGEQFLATLARTTGVVESDLHYLAVAPAVPDVSLLAGAVPGLAAQWPVNVPGLHRLHLPAQHLTLDLLIGPVDAWLPEIVARVDEFIIPEPLASIRALQRLATPASTLRIRQPDEQRSRVSRSSHSFASQSFSAWQKAACMSSENTICTP